MQNIVSLERKPDAGTIIMQLAAVFLITGVSLFVFSFLGLYLASAITGLSINGIANLSTSAPENVIVANKILQFVSTVGTFLAPALLIPLFLFRASPIPYLSLNRNSPLLIYIMAMLAYFTLIPFLEWTIQINQQMHLPAAWKTLEEAIRKMETTAGAITQRFLEMPTFGSFIFTSLIMALFPAVCEELFFRGLLQRTIFSWTRRIHLSIIVTSFIFSFIHFQFYGFLPRMLLGMLLGYVLFWTGDIKVSIFIHFINNFSAVLAAYIGEIKHRDIDPDKMQFSPFLVITSLVLGGIILYGIYKAGLRKKEERRATENTTDNSSQNDRNWVKLYSTDKQYEAEILLGTLKNENIEAVIVNKKDSSYNSFGQIEIHIPQEQLEDAMKVLNKIKDVNPPLS